MILTMKTQCKRCGKEFKSYPSQNRQFCSLYCSNHSIQKNTGRTHFKKGLIPHNKNKFKLTSRVRQTTYYRRLIFEESENRLCNRCSNEAKLVHHINRNWHDNRIENLEPLCLSCHAKEHDLSENLPKDGGWSKRNIKGGNK